jgi:hypothetical protein
MCVGRQYATGAVADLLSDRKLGLLYLLYSSNSSGAKELAEELDLADDLLAMTHTSPGIKLR